MPEVPEIDLSTYLIDQKTLELVPASLARKYKLMPIFKIGNTITVAMADPSNIIAIDELRSTTSLDVDVVSSKGKDLEEAISQYYGLADTVEEVIKELKKKKEGGSIKLEEEAPIIKLVNMFIMQAVMEKASDIHIEPTKDLSQIRFRVDGILHKEAELPLEVHPAIISRIKVLSGMDIAETRVPQDGRFEMQVEGRTIDMRVSSLPSIKGEKLVLRILDKAAALFSLEELGFTDEELLRFKQVIKRPFGMILVTGPTGSGKTSTLYAALNYLNSIEKNILTIEDPVEFNIEGITQSQVNLKAGLTFGNALRSMLRQDPDIILVGEIRDLETAQIAIRAALTGHLVFSTLHTNDAAGAMTRLVDMGVEPFLVASSVIDIIAQRLVRTKCDKCHGKGCKVCRRTGYRGRLGLFEQLVVDEKITKLMTDKASSLEIKRAAMDAGMKTLTEDGMAKFEKGKTTKEEVMRVTTLD